MGGENPANFVLQALFGGQHNFAILNHQVDRISEESVGSISVEDADRFIRNHDPENQLAELCHLIDVLSKARDCFKSVIDALDACLRTLFLVSRRFGDLSDLFTGVDDQGQEIDGPGDPTVVAETMVKSLRRILFFARIQEERLGNIKLKFTMLFRLKFIQFLYSSI